MLSVNVYDLENNDIKNSSDIIAFDDKTTELINNVDEEIETSLTCNNLTPSGYRNFRIVTDRVYDQTVRVFNSIARQVIIQESYQAYFKERDTRPNGSGALVTLCTKDESEKTKQLLEKRFGMQFKSHIFNLIDLIESANDVRNAKFNVQIETVTSISMKGTNVNTTEYYTEMSQQGNLKAVILSWDMPAKTVSFRIGTEGNILLYNNLNDYEILDLVDQLLNITP